MLVGFGSARRALLTCLHGGGPQDGGAMRPDSIERELLAPFSASWRVSGGASRRVVDVGRATSSAYSNRARSTVLAPWFGHHAGPPISSPGSASRGCFGAPAGWLATAGCCFWQCAPLTRRYGAGPQKAGIRPGGVVPAARREHVPPPEWSASPCTGAHAATASCDSAPSECLHLRAPWRLALALLASLLPGPCAPRSRRRIRERDWRGGPYSARTAP